MVRPSAAKRSRAAASSTHDGRSSAPTTKRSRTAAAPISAGASRRRVVAIKPDPENVVTTMTTATENSDSKYRQDLKEQFIQMFSDPKYEGGVSNSALKAKFGEKAYLELPPIINELTASSRLSMAKCGPDDELFYNLVSEQVASQFTGLDVQARMVYQVIEKAGNMGIWTKDIRTQTNIQQQAVNKIFKALETRRLIKPVKSVTAKAKKLYMIYNLAPAKEITGGPWYTELEFDHEFISELRTFLMHCVRRLNGGRGVTLAEIKDKMVQSNVSRVQLSLEEVKQLMQTLAFDHQIEQSSVNERGEALFVASRRVTPMCEFKWWDVLSPDFHFREIRFEDGVTLSAHEPHHHTA